ncbi:MAG: family 43 glycosylhydrolase [Bacteroidota bacterium]|nr:family 43 glycosylhydrolase [Bacteroidota bacterium]
MIRSALLLIVMFIFQNCLFAQDYPKVILRGDYPDPSIMRDGENYYMTHSPFVYSPGFLIWHSKDLINWEPICRALVGHTGSAMAPDLLKYNNRYYIYYPAAGTNWVIWADNIRGPWSKPIDLHVTGHIDPGHSVGEDGRRYLHVNDGYIVPLSGDGLSVAGKPEKIYSGWEYPKSWIAECMCLESPKVIKKGDYFYMTTAEGGTAGPATSHMVVSARSKSIRGSWENSPYNPIAHTYSADERWWSKGHGTIIDDVNGDWWMVFHAYENGAYTLGRQTLLQPIQWTKDGWFYADNKAKSIEPKGDSIKHGMKLSDDFQGKALGLQWTTWQNFDINNVFLKKGSLYMKGKGTNPKDAQLLLTTATDKNYDIQVEITVKKGSVGGLILFYSEKAFAGVSSDGNQFTIYENAEKQTTRPNKLGNHFFAKVLNAKNICSILVSKNKQNWDTICSGLDVSDMHHNKYHRFFALRPGLMAAGNGEVKFNDFEYKPQQGYLFAYFTDKNANRNGMHLAWSRDGYQWTKIGDEYSFLKSDYGDQDKDKRMRDPFLMKGADGLWHCLWTINWNINTIGHSTSADLIHWTSQQTIPVMEGYEARNCWAPEMIYDDKSQRYIIFWSSTIKINSEWKVEPGYKYDNRIYYTSTKDFRTFAPAKLLFDPGHNVIDATVNKTGSKYFMVYKNESELPTPQKNLFVAVSDNAEGPYKKLSDKSFTKNWVEGPSINQLPNNSFLVYMDSYKDKRYEAKRTRDFKVWEDVSDKVSLPTGAKHGSVVSVPMDFIDDVIFDQKRAEQEVTKQASKEGVIAPKPVFRDPVYDGAADPIVIWNPQVKKWWMYYTNRRATMTELPGVSWVFGTPIGIAESTDGANWKYAGVANFPDLPAECGGKDVTEWAPDIVLGDDGKWHMYLSVVPGIDTKWGLPGFIAHLTSANLRDWKYERRLSQLGTRVIDSDILKMPDGIWRMYYKDQTKYSHINVTESKDLYNWSEPKEALRINGEGPIAFQWKGYYWLIIDTWNGQTVHRSVDGNTWTVQPGGPLMPDDEGTGKDDVPNALHANVVISNDRAYMYYFTHPGRIGADKKKDTYEQRRTSIQVVELELDDAGWITANRNKPTYVKMSRE